MEPGQRALILSGTTDDINEARAGEGSSNKWLRLEFLSTVMAHFGRETQASYGLVRQKQSQHPTFLSV